MSHTRAHTTCINTRRNTYARARTHTHTHTQVRQLVYAFPSLRAIVIKSACMRDFANRLFVCNEVLGPGGLAH